MSSIITKRLGPNTEIVMLRPSDDANWPWRVRAIWYLAKGGDLTACQISREVYGGCPWVVFRMELRPT